MISKRELMVRIIDLEMVTLRQEEELLELSKKIEELEGKKKAKKAVKKK